MIKYTDWGVGRVETAELDCLTVLEPEVQDQVSAGCSLGRAEEAGSRPRFSVCRQLSSWVFTSHHLPSRWSLSRFLL